LLLNIPSHLIPSHLKHVGTLAYEISVLNNCWLLLKNTVIKTSIGSFVLNYSLILITVIWFTDKKYSQWAHQKNSTHLYDAK